MVAEIVQSGVFWPAWYRQRNPDAPQGDLGALQHYLEQGWRRGSDPGPFFSVRWYLERSPDLVELEVEPLHHFLVQGWREGRSPFPGFDPLAYAEERELLDGDVCPLVHLLAYAGLADLDDVPSVSLAADE